jgi:hypothetical protein
MVLDLISEDVGFDLRGCRILSPIDCLTVESPRRRLGFHLR